MANENKWLCTNYAKNCQYHNTNNNYYFYCDNYYHHHLKSNTKNYSLDFLTFSVKYLSTYPSLTKTR